MSNKPDFSFIKNDKLRETFEKIDFEKATSSFIEKIKKEEEESKLYLSNGDFEKDLNKIKEYLNSHEHFCFESNGYHNYIEFVSEKYLLKNIYNSVKENEDQEGSIFDEQEYDIDYEDLRFNFLHGLGTIVTVYKI